MARAIWSGSISFGLVSIPVKLYTAIEERDISFHQVHREDAGRIRYKRVCSVDGEEVPYADIAKGYELPDGDMVVLTDEDFATLPLPSRHTIELSQFVNTDEIDPIFYEKTYYLEPEETGLKPYILLMKVLEDKGVTGLATIAIRNKESLCALRPQDGTLLLETLYYPDEIRERDALPNVLVNDREVAVAGTLVDALAEPFDPSKYHDRYRQALMELIESKMEGKQVVAPEGAPTAPVTDLMSALRASIEAARKRKGGAADEEQQAPERAAARSRAKQGDHKAREAKAAPRGRKKQKVA
jgi:DNA end-binding protein Ku